jgi:hypothetical protein
MTRIFRTVTGPAPAVASPAPDEDGLHLPSLHGENGRRFLFAGDATFIVESPSGRRMEYWVHLRQGPVSMFRIKVRGVGGKYPYRYLAVLHRDGRLESVGRSEFLQGTQEFDVAQWAVQAILNNTMLSPGYDIRHDNKCGGCSRSLDPAYQERGIGPECWARIVAASTEKE